MEHKEVNSSNIHHIGYDKKTRTLEVKFKGSSGTYHYHGVAEATFHDFLKAPSHGKYLHQHIRPHHKFTKVS